MSLPYFMITLQSIMPLLDIAEGALMLLLLAFFAKELYKLRVAVEKKRK